MLGHTLSLSKVADLVSNLHSMQFEIRACLEKLQSTFGHIQDLYNFTDNGLERISTSMSSVSTSTMLTSRIKLAGWLERREGTWKLNSRSTSTTMRSQQRDSVFMSQSDFQRGEFLDTDHSKSQPSAGVPQDPGWDEVERIIAMMQQKSADDPAAPSQPSAGAPQGPCWDEVDRLLAILGKSQPSTVASQGLWGEVDRLIAMMEQKSAVVPSQPPTGAPQDPCWDEVDRLLGILGKSQPSTGASQGLWGKVDRLIAMMEQKSADDPAALSQPSTGAPQDPC